MPKTTTSESKDKEMKMEQITMKTWMKTLLKYAEKLMIMSNKALKAILTHQESNYQKANQLVCPFISNEITQMKENEN